MVRQRVNENRRVLARLDNLVEVADAADLDGARQGAVDPHRLVTLEKVTSDQVAGGEVFVAGYRHQRKVVTVGQVAAAVSVLSRSALANPGQRLAKPV